MFAVGKMWNISKVPCSQLASRGASFDFFRRSSICIPTNDSSSQLCHYHPLRCHSASIEALPARNARTMGLFDIVSDLFEAATPWSTVEAEAVQRGGAGSEKTPADKDEGGEGEAEVCL